MVLQNKLGIVDLIELAKVEEKLSKQKAKQLFITGKLDTFEVGTFQGLSSIHTYLFEDVYDFAGVLRDVNIAKGNFRFAPVMYLKSALMHIDTMPQATFAEIVEKYVEMNVAHPFREGNGRSTRIWIDMIFKKELARVVDWRLVDKEDYLLAMERSPVKDTEIKYVLKKALTDKINSREVYMKGIDVSYYYEGYTEYKTKHLRTCPRSHNDE
jgi:cell filamentation protein